MISSRSRKRSKFLRLGIAALVLSCILSPAVTAAPQITDAGIPISVNAGEPIPIRINITSDSPPVYMVLLYYTNPSTGQEKWIEMIFNTTDGVWTCEIPAQSWESQVNCRITAKDNSGEVQYYSTIDILGEEQPKEFPWNLVVIIIFLGVVLVLTELVFKPGLYRPTGRERAKALEEEDRKREQEESDKDN